MAAAVGGAARPVTRRTVGLAAAAPQPSSARGGRGGAHQGLSDRVLGPGGTWPEALGHRNMGIWGMSRTKRQRAWSHREDWGIDMWHVDHPRAELLGSQGGLGHGQLGCLPPEAIAPGDRQKTGAWTSGQETNASRGRERTRVWASRSIQHQRPDYLGAQRG